MRKINKIIIHCSATLEGRDITAAEIRRWHTLPKPQGNGWNDIGYHYVIDLDGTLEVGRPLNQVGAHCKGHNTDSIGICYVGGLDKNKKAKDTRTPMQRETLLWLLRRLKAAYPDATIHGHNEFAPKACPSFDVQKWLQEVQFS